MANPVVNMTVCTCSFGSMPMTLPVSSQQTVMACNMPVATVLNNQCTTFGMCSCPNNPAVVAATAAAMGVLTASACLPAILTPWSPGESTVLVCGKPLLDSTSKLSCIYGGVIEVKQTPAKTIRTP